VSLSDLTDRDAVLRAIAEYDELGSNAFLEKYGFGRARTFWLKHDGNRYDSKAITGAAFGYQFPDRGPLRPNEFSGGERTVQPLLEALGFEFEVEAAPKEISQWFLNLRTGTLTSGQPAPHKPLLALLVMCR
jgi:hypothetical protein